MWKDFKAFIMRGNVLDLAIAVIIGGAFGKIVSSLVTDIIMPPIGKLLGGINFTNLFIGLSRTHYTSLAEAQKAGAVTINYGNFLDAIINFLIIAIAIFLVIRVPKRFTKPTHTDPTSKECPYCMSSIAIKATRCPQCTSQLPPASS